MVPVRSSGILTNVLPHRNVKSTCTTVLSFYLRTSQLPKHLNNKEVKRKEKSIKLYISREPPISGIYYMKMRSIDLLEIYIFETYNHNNVHIFPSFNNNIIIRKAFYFRVSYSS